MALPRTTTPTLAAFGTVALLIAGVTVGAVEARHHHRAAPKTTSTHLDLSQEQSVAHQLATMTLPGALAHTTVCPNTAGTTDVCFTGTLTKPATSALTAADEAEKMMTALGVTLGTTRKCSAATGSPLGSGYLCAAVGTWHTNNVATTVFVSDQATRPANTPGIDAMIGVLPS